MSHGQLPGDKHFIARLAKTEVTIHCNDFYTLPHGIKELFDADLFYL